MPYRNLNDETLVMLTLAGEQSAYEVLVTRHQRTVLATAMSVTHREFMAEDAAQDAFVSAWMKLDTLQEPKKFGAWVCRIAKNCAVNMVTRYRTVLPLDTLVQIEDHTTPTQTELDEQAQDKEELHRSLGKLPTKVKEVIHLHYFEGLSIVEIADRMRITPGTVKSQLHDGRKRIRKELCAMNEKWNDTLVERVMKKVEELKAWQVKNDKNGFERIYRDVLREFETLPESNTKYHALADVLIRGCWWLPGEKNDALFARIKEAAEIGHNEDAMSFIIGRENNRVPHGDLKNRNEFILKKQIPYLEEHGFVKALAAQWMDVADNYFQLCERDEGRAALARVRSMLTPADLDYALALYTGEIDDLMTSKFFDREIGRYRLGARAECLHYIDGKLRYWQNGYMGRGWLNSVNEEADEPFRIASRCDGMFFDEALIPGQVITGTDGTTLTYVTDRETVETPAGVFDCCQLWVTNYVDRYAGRMIVRAYYKEGVGIVKYTLVQGCVTDNWLLTSYHIVGGKGLLPLAVGNKWEYCAQYDPAYLRTELTYRVIDADEKSVMIAGKSVIDRIGYNVNVWSEMMAQIRNDYYIEKNGVEGLHDVSDAMERAQQLAKTPLEKVHTEFAVDVARRIFDTEENWSPDREADGIWNFFQRDVIRHERGRVLISRDPIWSFEWKSWQEGAEPLLCNHVYGILRDALNCLWSDEFRIGMDTMVEYDGYSNTVKTSVNCTDGGTVVTPAGSFENCMKMSLEISGMSKGIGYRGGHKEYFFAPGIGIVKAVHEYDDEPKTVTYELVSYTGTGEGYMPFTDGLRRKYEAQGLTDGFYAACEYAYVADENGDLVILANKTGIRRHLQPSRSC